MLGSLHKAEKVKKLNCEIFIEDRYDNAIELTLAGFQVEAWFKMQCRLHQILHGNPLLDRVLRSLSLLD